MIIENILRLISQPVYAAGNPPTLEKLAESIDTVLEYIFPAGALIAVAMVIYGGYMWIISGGDPARKQQAQGVLTWSVLGLVFLFLIKAVLTVIIDYIYQ
ncbi:MAG: hypothetical protein UR61_C0009G0007 [candidate division WS6 bacterium GW2011_GWE1_34_7]|uniref:Uncharacterized protein n=1 Tax=candidate division WS6 bacterium GW2011_GWE1_34_7 TaxID=1619093 RepID=A0A0G0DS66_9BACT|nr:MAG: hypothetical protein UR61_C0009G0007 [candidate division WS6 bacterium GW2011_GWE1_34_7]